MLRCFVFFSLIFFLFFHFLCLLLCFVFVSLIFFVFFPFLCFSILSHYSSFHTHYCYLFLLFASPHIPLFFDYSSSSLPYLYYLLHYSFFLCFVLIFLFV